jgi:hypothetical protein
LWTRSPSWTRYMQFKKRGDKLSVKNSQGSKVWGLVLPSMRRCWKKLHRRPMSKSIRWYIHS